MKLMMYYRRVWWTLLVLLLMLAGVCIAQDTLPHSEEAVLASGNAQAVLAVCLIAVTTALMTVSALLYKAQKDRIEALEKSQESVASRAKADGELANSLDRLREHCEGHRSHT